jgi:hypothetical protein
MKSNAKLPPTGKNGKRESAMEQMIFSANNDFDDAREAKLQ